MSRLRNRRTLTAALVLMASCSTLLMGCHGGGASSAPWSATAVTSILCQQGKQIGTLELTIDVNPNSLVASLDDNLTFILSGWVYTVLNWNIIHGTGLTTGWIEYQVMNQTTQEVCKYEGANRLEVAVCHPSTGGGSGPT